MLFKKINPFVSEKNSTELTGRLESNYEQSEEGMKKNKGKEQLMRKN